VFIGQTADCDCDAPDYLPLPTSPDSLFPSPPNSQPDCASATALVNAIVDTYNEFIREADAKATTSISVGIAVLELLAFLAVFFSFLPGLPLFNIVMSAFILKMVRMFVDLTPMDEYEGDLTDAICAAKSVIDNSSGEITLAAIQAATSQLTPDIAEFASGFEVQALAQLAYTRIGENDCYVCDTDADWILDIRGSRIWDNPVWSFPVGGVYANQPRTRLANGIEFAFYSYGALAAEVTFPNGNYTFTRIEVYMSVMYYNTSGHTAIISWYQPSKNITFVQPITPSSYAFSQYDIAFIHNHTDETFATSSKRITADTIARAYLGRTASGDTYSSGVITRIVLYGVGERPFAGLPEERELQ
jgi:hypothetical protein